MIEFKTDDDMGTNVILGNEFEQECDKLRQGYILAAKELLEIAIKRPSTHAYSLIYPILYCFRHYLELELKYNYKHFNGNWPSFESHKLEWYSVIWDEYKDLTGKRAPKQIKEYIELFQLLDQNAVFFKYEFGKNGYFRKETLELKGGNVIEVDNIYHVGLHSLREDIKIISDFFLELKFALEEQQSN